MLLLLSELSPGRRAVPVYLLRPGGLEDWKTARPAAAARLAHHHLSGKPGQGAPLYEGEELSGYVHILPAEPDLHAYAALRQGLEAAVPPERLERIAFDLQPESGAPPGAEGEAALGWRLADYSFERYKTAGTAKPALATPAALIVANETARRRAEAQNEAIRLCRDLINEPANRLGPEELAGAAKTLAKRHKGKCKVIKGAALTEGFPLIDAVGAASTRPPCLIELRWGDKAHPPVTLVGKGVVFDTGGLDLKPPPFMGMMKKDMGGAAHVLGLAAAIMALELPVALRVLIPAAENSVAGNAMRPGDVIPSRKGLSVEIGDTDAEGRLVVADALTLACEEKVKPGLLVDFCTLTGSARAALGYDIPAFFSNKDELLVKLVDIGRAVHDPIWPLPLWHGYRKEMDSKIADISNIGTGKAGAIHGALFLHEFIDTACDWVHLDCYAWEQSGKAGRPAGGADTGLRAMLAYIEGRYAPAGKAS